MTTPTHGHSILALFAASATLALAGCDVGDPAEADARDDASASADASVPADDSADDEWVEFPEPFGDESYLKYKLAPANPTPGVPVSVTVQTGSIYGPIDTAAWLRVGDAARPVSFDAPSPDAWQPMADAGLFVVDLDDDGNETTRPADDQTAQEEHDGYDLHTGTLALPSGPGRTIELLIEQDDFEGSTPTKKVRNALVLWPGEVAGAH